MTYGRTSVARISYDQKTALAFQRAREVPRAGLNEWREAIERHLKPRTGMRVLDIGAGTGAFTTALRDWFDVTVTAVEPASAMRALIPAGPGIQILPGTAEALPVGDAVADGAWLSTVTHHIADLPAAARELRRALRPRAPVLIRNVFPGRLDRLSLVRFFPEVRQIFDTYPSIAATGDAFATAGFRQVALETVPQQNAPSLNEYAALIDRDADTGLRSLTDQQFAEGMARLRAAAEAENAASAPAPVVGYLDLLVLR
ncbi:class I SAM-dependent methyltransferase [Streptomyces sp. NPDC021080]|uniref:class I SAM-dependent methyltransferase n=1 Tax=Streptomyces sp. NPDC021080 TaxID=3365110 RepID=UPI00379BADD5